MTSPAGKPTQAALEARARRAATAVGWVAQKARARIGIDNHGGFRLVEGWSNTILYGEKFDLSPEDVVDLCAYFDTCGVRML